MCCLFLTAIIAQALTGLVCPMRTFPHFHTHPQKERRKEVAKKEERKRLPLPILP